MDNVFDFLKENKESIVKVSEDKMNAALELAQPPNDAGYTLEDILALLDNNGIKQGIDQTTIGKMLEKKIYGKPVTVARGKPAVDGEAGNYIYHFREKMPSMPKILPDGSVDYLNLELFESVEAGQVVAEYIPATAGAFGYTVTGEMLTPKRGADLPPLRGTGFVLSEDKKKYIALKNGKIEFKDGKLEISNVYTISGNLDLSIGNVRFDGDVNVLGNMASGLSIIATGDVIIDGHVENAEIRSGKNVILKQGMQGAGTGCIESAGTVSGKFFEAVNINAKGDVNANYFLNCQVNCEGTVTVSGSKGVIIGGKVRALQCIKAHGLGNMAEIPTIVETGINPEYVEQYNNLNKAINKVDSEITILLKNAAMFEKTDVKKMEDILGKNKKVDKVLYDKIKQALVIKKRERDKYLKEKVVMLTAINNMGKSRIIVENKVYPGVKIIIDSEMLHVTGVYKGVQFVRRDNKISALLIG